MFAAWAEPSAKASWFAGEGAEHELDFRVGGTELARSPRRGDQPALRFQADCRDIVPNERIVYTATLYADDRPATVSLTTVQFTASGDGTTLLLTEQGTFLDGLEAPEWREQGVTSQLDALRDQLAEALES